MISSRIFLTLGISSWMIGFSAAAEVKPILQTYCLTCHSEEKQEGELDLENSDIYKNPTVWEHVLDQLELKEMPPKKAKQMTPEEEKTLVAWIRNTLDKIALSNAGDPGPVTLRRLSNHEYTYTLRDLTGIASLDPAREFPVDGAAGEGFTNVGSALVMSPALLTKYLDAAKNVAAHAVFTPTGFHWSESTSSLDWTNETLADIRKIYQRYTVTSDGTQKIVDGVKLDTGTGGGRLPYQDYFEAIQGRRDTKNLSPKYLGILRAALESSQASILLDPLRAKFKAGTLNVADIEPWQQALWSFGHIGHLAEGGKAKTWQNPVTPLLSHQEHRVSLNSGKDQTLYLVSHSAGDGATGDDVTWKNARLIAPGRQDLPISNLPELIRHLEGERTKILDSTESMLQSLAEGSASADPALLAIWKEYFGFTGTPLEHKLTEKRNSTQNHDFIKAWKGSNALNIVANSSDKLVRIPGIMKPHSVAMHSDTNRDAVIAWKSPVKGKLEISGYVERAHTGCGGGAAWSLEVRRGKAVERLASGIAPGGKPFLIGPFEEIKIEPGQAVALVVGPRNKTNTCGLTAVHLVIKDGSQEWDLTKQVSPNLLAGNPNGPWHFLSQPTLEKPLGDLPAPMVAWREAPSAALAKKVREHLEKDFPLNHSLLTSAIRHFKPTAPPTPIVVKAPAIHEITIPAALARGTEFVVNSQLVNPEKGSVQTQVLSQRPAIASTEIDSKLPILVGENSESRKKLEQTFQEFRALFPISVSYTRIVPVDEGVTLSLFHREDEHLSRLVLSEQENQTLNRLWEELRFVSEAPLKQFDAFEQLVQYATQIRAERAVEFEKLRGSLTQAIEDYKRDLANAENVQGKAILQFAEKAWRRPLRAEEIASLKKFTPRMMLARVLISPAFLYKAEEIPAQTHPVNDWELATRLSYFLWSSSPDAELSKLAAAGKLRDPAVLAAQAKRMLKDPKIARLSQEFGCQWLHVRDLGTLDEKSERHFPTFLKVREAMQEEVARFFTDLFHRDQSVLSLLDADHTFVNEILAEHYGIKISGASWQRVEGMKKLGRGGILGFAAPLAKHSGASRTSAILRGTWMSEVILGDKLPPPPRGVPVLPDEFPEGLTERQLIERHTKDPNCASCHKRIDPYGFALEAFDAIGRSRQADTSTVLHDGVKIDGLGQLREYLLTQRRHDFLEQFCRKLLGYSLGRAYQLSDRPLLEAMIQSDLKASTLIEMIVSSRQFREVRGSEITGL